MVTQPYSRRSPAPDAALNVSHYEPYGSPHDLFKICTLGVSGPPSSPVCVMATAEPTCSRYGDLLRLLTKHILGWGDFSIFQFCGRGVRYVTDRVIGDEGEMTPPGRLCDGAGDGRTRASGASIRFRTTCQRRPQPSRERRRARPRSEQSHITTYRAGTTWRRFDAWAGQDFSERRKATSKPGSPKLPPPNPRDPD